MVYLLGWTAIGFEKLQRTLQLGPAVHVYSIRKNSGIQSNLVTANWSALNQDCVLVGYIVEFYNVLYIYIICTASMMLFGGADHLTFIFVTWVAHL